MGWAGTASKERAVIRELRDKSQSSNKARFRPDSPRVECRPCRGTMHWKWGSVSLKIMGTLDLFQKSFQRAHKRIKPIHRELSCLPEYVLQSSYKYYKISKKPKILNVQQLIKIARHMNKQGNVIHKQEKSQSGDQPRSKRDDGNWILEQLLFMWSICPKM